MSRVVDRAFDIASATWSAAPRDGLSHPFGFDEHSPYRWRVSEDVWQALRAHVGFVGPDKPTPGTVLLGEPLQLDEALPPNSMLLEPVASDLGSR